MWVAKILIPWAEGLLLGGRTRKFNVTIKGYPLSYYWFNDKFLVTISAYLIGSEINRKAFLADLKKDKRTIKVEMFTENFGIWLIQQHSGTRVVFDPKIISVKPAIITNVGDCILEVGSWEKEKLARISKSLVSSPLAAKLLYLKKAKIEDIRITSQFPDLTEKQKNAFQLAMENGYYEFPRKIELQQLAKLSKSSYSTFQFHLRTAEKKLLKSLV